MGKGGFPLRAPPGRQRFHRFPHVLYSTDVGDCVLENTNPSGSLSAAPAPCADPVILQGHIASLFQATFAEIALFVAAFLVVTQKQTFQWQLTNFALAIFLAGLGTSAFILMQLHSLRPRTLDQACHRYQQAWWAFAVANVTILVYFLAWWLHVVFLVF
jgi:hypothetical protein